MRAEDHPEYVPEQTVLELTREALARYIQYLTEGEADGADAHTGAVLKAHFAERAQRYQAAQDTPYFGRIDFFHTDEPAAATYYLGKVGFEHDHRHVIDWRAPIAAFFYQGQPGPQNRVIRQPSGTVTVSGQLLLKRHLNMAAGQLTQIADEFDLRPQSAGQSLATIVDPDDYLRQVLQGRRDPRLSDIVATIQARQYELIHAALNQVLVVQGVAGSGKTSIALHRLAFLLYPDRNQGLDPRRCMVFGPNQLLLGYIAHVLPGLGVAQLPQNTLEAWALRQIDLASMTLSDRTLDAILATERSRDEKTALYRQSQLKTSRRMGQVLEAYVAAWRAQVQLPAAGVTIPRLGPLKVAVTLTADELRAVWKDEAALPPAQHRERFLAAVAGRLAGQYETAVERQARPGVASSPTSSAQARRLRDQALADPTRAEISAQIRQRVTQEAARWWPEMDLLAAYSALWKPGGPLTALAEGVFNATELKLLRQNAPVFTGEILDLSDLPALHYLHILLHGVPVGRFDHVVIDEAQDVSALQLETLRRYSRNGSFTLLGDMAQSIYAHRGLRNWEEVAQVFTQTNVNYQEINRSYRSTLEIMGFANRVLAGQAQRGRAVLLAEPFERHGREPALIRVASPDEMAARAAAVVGQAQHQGYQTIAIIGKTVERCNAFASVLRRHLKPFTLVVTPEREYTGGVVLLPVHLAKGMEFEVAVVIEADDRTYTTTEYDGRMLYVALTRGLHELYVLTMGAPSRYLEANASTPSSPG